MGCVASFRLVCAHGCCYNWSSAKPLPGLPATEEAESGDAGNGPREAGTAVGGTAAAGAAATNAEASELCAAEVRRRLRRAVAAQRRIRPKLQLKQIVDEAALSGRAHVESLRCYLSGESSSVAAGIGDTSSEREAP
eukprot:2393970-Prymnesium_polylepis.1